MSGISLQSGIIYGPVFSRRLGRSLGINLLPTTHKLCSFDCIYCQYGRGQGTSLVPNGDVLPTIDQVLSAVERALKKPRTLDYLTFSGNGEPTIHPGFSTIVEGVIELRDKIRPGAKVAVLSNSSRVTDAEVLSVLKLVYAPMMKLDAGDEETFNLINRPSRSINLQEILGSLREIPNLVIQSAFIDGNITNIRGDAFHAWVAALQLIEPKLVHIYSAERPTADESVLCVSPKKLKGIADALNRQYGLNVKAFWS